MKKKSFLQKKILQKFFYSHSVYFFWKSFDLISQPSQLLLSWKLAQMFLRGIARTCGSRFWKKSPFFGFFFDFWKSDVIKKPKKIVKKKFLQKRLPHVLAMPPRNICAKFQLNWIRCHWDIWSEPQRLIQKRRFAEIPF